MRYQEDGEVHLDFHRTLNGTIRYIRETHGREVLDQTFRQTATEVYRAIHDDLKRGDWEQLITHWRYFMEREGGDFSLERGEDTVTLTVRRCPAIAYLREHGHVVDPDFCRQTEVMNAAWSEGTPFVIETRVEGDGRCVQTIRRRAV